ncbi:HAD family hydrolase [Hoyosella rhizosphaerae]|uniref:HAD family hydrolase n=1 Tax=Hoyosella rhizosphaerae TaxID=1755582 RepID=A0A916U0M3_9ACTN|nr:HAD family hydrolase [Hoyosella rhizosphaerae]MBN4927000.1 HAD family hydrolase [Hoyosella rhizosphaerae]GGC54829.1 hypothetical protein GCM10011410_04020 [Hoyosella rhizosphaerae]
MPLLLLDLDNTLIDRNAAFRLWANEFLSTIGAAGDLAWLMEADADGYTPRSSLAQQLRRRYQLSCSVPALVEVLLMQHVNYVTVEDAVLDNLDVARARARGWKLVVVTNGTVRQQEAKLAATGLGAHIDECVISEEVGYAKPSPLIFHAAAQSVGMPLRDGWMVGDHPLADIGGAHNMGLNSVWVSHGRAWFNHEFVPTLVASTAAVAISMIHAKSGR